MNHARWCRSARTDEADDAHDKTTHGARKRTTGRPARGGVRGIGCWRWCSAHELRNSRVQTSLVRLESPGFRNRVTSWVAARRVAPADALTGLCETSAPSGRPAGRRPPPVVEQPDATPRGAIGCAFERPVGAAPSERPEGAEATHSPVRALASATRRAATHHADRFNQPRRFKPDLGDFNGWFAQLVGGTTSRDGAQFAASMIRTARWSRTSSLTTVNLELWA
jgi:hypothetical protein